MPRKKELPNFYTARGTLQMQLQILGKTPKANMLILNIIRTVVDALSIDITFSQVTTRLVMLNDMLRWVDPGTNARSVAKTARILKQTIEVEGWWKKNYGKYK